jgi:lactoylglutathione lyase
VPPAAGNLAEPVASARGRISTMTEMASLVLFAVNPSATAAFYRALGLVLEDEHHGDGPVHFATELGPVHFAIYPAEAPGRARERRSGGSFFPGFYVESLDQAAEALARTGAPVLTGHEQMPWGCRVVAEDPDGRAVEINQRRHCPG